MNSLHATFASVVAAAMICAAGLTAQAVPGPAVESSTSSYVLGVGDSLVVRSLQAEELSDKPVRIDEKGYINLPLIGRVRASGLTVEQLESELVTRLKVYIQAPEVSVSVTDFNSQPVSVLGAVNQPGVRNLSGQKTLVEILALAGGLKPDAGNTIKITRRLESGRIPLPSAADDPTGQFSIAEVRVTAVMEATNPQENILILPNDVITVPRADMVFVVGEVPKSGGFVLNERESVTVLQALSLAGGLGKTAKPDAAKILRSGPNNAGRKEVAVNLKGILAGKVKDVPLEADDILFVPSSTRKTILYRSLETGLGMGATLGTGLLIYRR